MWIVFGTKDASVRVPGGASVSRRCASCGETAVFYEKTRTSTFRLYFIDIYDYKKNRVMECGACGAHYATDELGAREDKPVEKRLEEGKQAAAAFASSVTDKLTDLAAKVVNRPMPARPRSNASAFPEREPEPELTSDDFADDMELKFRQLEREEEDRKRRGG